MPQPFVLALLQLPAVPVSADHLALAVVAVRDAATKGAQVLVLPELFRTSYFCQTMDPAFMALAEALDGETVQTMQALAAELQVVIVVSLFECAAPGLYFNTAVVIDADGQVLGHYRKSHIPCDPQYEEKFYFTPGDTGFAVFSTRFVRLGVLICWDQWFPEAARETALRGAELIVYPTAIGWIDDEGQAEHARQLDAWVTVQRGHAIANGIYVAACNRVGREVGPASRPELAGGIEFWGNSFVAGPQGELLAQAGSSAAQTVLMSCDRDRLQEVRTMWPFFRDRRIDLYDGASRRWIAR